MEWDIMVPINSSKYFIIELRLFLAYSPFLGRAGIVP